MATISISIACWTRSSRARRAHDELLFIIQHQTSELWMKLAIHEINAATQAIADDDLQPAFKMLARVARIFEQLNNAWDVLRTMTPSEYTAFREHRSANPPASSRIQYRVIEFLAGNRNRAMLRPHAHRPELAGARSRRSWQSAEPLRRSAAAAGAPRLCHR